MKTYLCRDKSKNVLLPGQVDERPHRLGVLQVGLELLEVLLPVTDRGLAGHLLQAPHVAREREDVQVVIKENTGIVGGQTQDESFIKPVHDILVRLSAKPKEMLLMINLRILNLDTWKDSTELYLEWTSMLMV